MSDLQQLGDDEVGPEGVRGAEGVGGDTTGFVGLVLGDEDVGEGELAERGCGCGGWGGAG